MNVPLIINIVIAFVFLAVGALVAIVWSKYPQLREALSKPAVPRAASNDDSEPSTGKESFWFGLGYSSIAALTAILIPLGFWFGLQVARKWFGEELSQTSDSVLLTLVVIAGVISLLAVLMMAALAFSAVKLSDKSQALGLPEGSVRAVIALSLIVIFVITVVFLFGNLGRKLKEVQHMTLEQTKAIPGELVLSKRAEDPKVAGLQKAAEDAKGKPESAKAQTAADEAANDSLYTVERYVDPTRGSEDFAKQIITTISTLVVSISAFYFGSSTAISAQKSATAFSAPVISKQPIDIKVAPGETAEFSVGATGSNLSYQWQKVTDDGHNDIPGATNNAYRTGKATAEDNGAQYLCKVTNPAGTVTSRVAKLTVA